MASRVATVVAPTARGERTRRLLIDAATGRFARDGYRSTTVAIISRDAGLGSTTAFVHFDAAMFHEFVDRLIDLAEKEHLEQLLATVLDIIERHPLARRLLGGLEPDFTARVLNSESFDELRATVVPIVEEGQRRGAVRPDLHAADLADGLMGFVLAMAMASVQIGPAVDQAFGRGIETVLRGLLSEDPRRS
jgi:AcrR family transcriptional regulator